MGSAVAEAKGNLDKVMNFSFEPAIWLWKLVLTSNLSKQGGGQKKHILGEQAKRNC